MKRLDVVLVALVLFSALGLVQSQHRARIQFSELERLKNEARRLDELHGSLVLEQSTWADPARVEGVARARLGLVAPVAERSLTRELP